MGWISELFSSSVGGVIDSIGKAINDNVTSDEERLILANALAKIKADSKAKSEEIDVQFEKEISNRHEADMQSDSKLSKNIRPASLIFLLAVVSVLSVTDGNVGEFSVGEHYVSLFNSLLIVAFGFYFGGRSLEKMRKK